MKDKYLSVWTWPLRPRYYVTHPWHWFRQLWRNMKAAHNRATKGYCSWDWGDLDVWFIHVMPLMLRDMAMKGYAYPGSEPFETPEKWHSWLYRMADQLIYLQNEDNGNEFNKPYMDVLMKNPAKILTDELSAEAKELRDKYLNRSEEVYLEHNKLFKETMNELIEHWNCLWD